MRCLISASIVSLVLVWGSNAFAQCLPTMPSQTPQSAPATAASPAAPTGNSVTPTAALTPGDFRRSQTPFGGISPGDAYLQSLASMSPMGMVADLSAQQAATVAQQQARTAARRAMREPARARMRAENAARYFDAGVNAEHAGNYAAARKYYRRAAKIDGGQFSQDAREALAALSN